MAGKKRKHGGGSAASHAKAQKKKTKKLAAANQLQADTDAAAQQSDANTPRDVDTSTDTAARADSDADILSAELRESLGGNDGDVMVIVGKKVKKPKQDVVPDELLQQAAKMSKNKRRKMDALAARKVKEARREDLYKSLETTSLSKEQLNLMHSTAKLGHKETLRERLKRSMNLVKAGVALSAADERELLQQRNAGDDGDDNGAASDADASDVDGTDSKPLSAMNATEPVPQKATTNNTKQHKQATVAAAAASTDVSPVAVPTTTTTTQLQSDAMTMTNGKKKKKRRPVVITNIVPQRTDIEPVSAAIDTAASHFASPVDAAAAADNNADGNDAIDSSAQRSTSQNDALARLAALRKKNEERRRQKELDKLAPLSATVSESESAAVDPADVYVPTPIVLKTQAEMQALSRTTHLSYKTTLVTLKRSPAIQLARMQLPVCASEQEIMEAIYDHDVVILCGETGSGKTTQVPQFLYEAGYGHPLHPERSGRIGVTQPRRVAAVATAKRVAEELNVGFGAHGGHVGYQIRYDAAHVSDATRIKFMTDGILLKEIQQDFLLRQYSVLLLDEAHERNVNTDILIGLLSRIAPLRAQLARAELDAFQLLSPTEQAAAADTTARIQPLKLVVMSATLRVEDFTQNARLFPVPPPVLRVTARQFPVTVHFNKRTELDDYVDEAFKKVVKIHRKLPEGGVLVFLTGQREILQLCRKLRRVYAATTQRKGSSKRHVPQPRTNEEDDMPTVRPAAKGGPTTDRILREHDDIEEEGDLEDEAIYGSSKHDDTGAYDLEDEDAQANDSDDDDDEEDDALAVPFMHVLPLYSLLPNDEQMRVFDAPPSPQHRLIVVATNVAETSLTIPGIKYVVDAGRTKERVFDLTNGISSFDIQWISKASADQRAGRAGRTGPGHCYRLYSSAVFDTEFTQFSPPEILCQPIEDLVLQMKAMGIHNVLQFPFPTPPDKQAVQIALHSLANLGAITASGRNDGGDAAITPLGYVLVKFPVAARFAKMLLLAKELGVLEYTIAIVAGLSGHSPFIQVVDRRDKEKDDGDDADGEMDDKDKSKSKRPGDRVDDMEREWREAEQLRKHAQWIDADSDVLSLLRAAGAYAFTGGSSAFCVENHLHEKTMQHMLKLRQQLTRIVNALYADDSAFERIDLSPRLAPPDDDTQRVLRQIVAAGFLDQVAKRAPPGTITDGSKIERNCAYIAATGSVKEPVYIHPHSSVFTPDASKLPSFVVYQHIMRTTRAYLKMVTAVEPAWLASIGKGTPLCTYSAPLTEPPPFYNAEADEVQCYAKAQYGTHQWALPVVQIPYPDDLETTKRDSGGLANKYRWFAKFVLDGVVIAGLKPFVNGLKEPSHLVIRKKFDKKIQLLVRALQQSEITSRTQLVDMWQTRDPLFLKHEIQAWIADDRQAAFAKQWRTIVNDATRA